MVGGAERRSRYGAARRGSDRLAWPQAGGGGEEAMGTSSTVSKEIMESSIAHPVTATR